MKEIKKLEQSHLDRIEKLLKDHYLGAAVNDYSDGSRSYFLSGTSSMYGIQPLTIDYNGKEYTLHLDTNEGQISYTEDKQTVDNNQDSVIAKLTETIIKRYNANQHARAASKKEQQQAEQVAIKKAEKEDAAKQDGNEVKKLNKFHLAIIKLIMKDPGFRPQINDYNDGSRSYFLTGTRSWNVYESAPLRIDYKNKEYTLSVKTKDNQFSYKEPEGNVINNPKSEIGKLVDVFIKGYNQRQHETAARKKELDQLLSARK